VALKFKRKGEERKLECCESKKGLGESQGRVAFYQKRKNQKSWKGGSTAKQRKKRGGEG